MTKLFDGSLKYGVFSEMGPFETVTASAPCRLDMGGTLDISTLHFSLQRFRPVTVNLAINLRTQVRLSRYTPGVVKVSSQGFEPAEFPEDRVPFDHPLGLIFAVAAYFGVHGVHIEIDSASPPRSGLGGSSVAAVALVAALVKLGEGHGGKPFTRRRIALIAHAIEAAVNMVPCGYQDQLAAAYGGVNAWEWHADIDRSKYSRRILIKKSAYRHFEKQLLLAYCGVPHVSNDINGKWLQQFMTGENRRPWIKMIACTHRFAAALTDNDIQSAVAAINEEVELRMELTPDVIGGLGLQLMDVAHEAGCAARFTGAGGGGCIWAFGDHERILSLKPLWDEVVSTDSKAGLIEHGIDVRGVVVG